MCLRYLSSWFSHAGRDGTSGQTYNYGQRCAKWIDRSSRSSLPIKIKYTHIIDKLTHSIDSSGVRDHSTLACWFCLNTREREKYYDYEWVFECVCVYVTSMERQLINQKQQTILIRHRTTTAPSARSGTKSLNIEKYVIKILKNTINEWKENAKRRSERTKNQKQFMHSVAITSNLSHWSNRFCANRHRFLLNCKPVC